MADMHAPSASAAAGSHIDFLRADGVVHLSERGARVPRAVVWTPLPGITWLLPPVGHVGITTADGRVTDFSAPYTVTVGAMMCGPARRVWRLGDGADGAEHDRAVDAAACAYGQKMHRLVLDNCHSHVACALNEMRYAGRDDWNMVRVWFAVWRHGQWVSKGAAVESVGPFVGLVLLVIAISVSSAVATR